MISGMRARRRSAFKTGGGYKFYRLYITQTHTGATYTNLRELELLTADSQNVALLPGGIATASSVEPSQFSREPENAFDGTTTSIWASDPAEGLPAWVAIKLAVPAELASYAIEFTATIATKPSSWEFQASRDGEVWTVLDAQSGLTPAANERRVFQL